MTIHVKRIYEDAARGDGFRVLVDRLWPRGISKEKAKIDIWLKEVAPSNELRKWFHHEEQKWDDFVTRYKAELKDAEALKELKGLAQKHKNITLLYGARDEEHNQALVLKALLSR